MSENTNKDTGKLQKKVEEQVKIFKENRHYFADLRNVIIATLDNAAKTLPGYPIVHGRVKAIDSFAEKCIRKHSKYDKPAWQLTDLCGVRVIVLSKDAIPAVRQFIEENFIISENEDTSQRLKEMEFGYQSVHYIASLDINKRDFYQAPDGNIPELLFKTRSIAEAKNESLPIGSVFNAEIQVRTLLQHAWSAAVHDNLYKTAMKKRPQHLLRESALIAALLDDADVSIVSLIDDVQEYRSYYGAYMTPEEIMQEISIQRIVLANNPENKAAALKIARLADCFADTSELESVEKDLATFEETADADILRELGMVRWKLGKKEKGRKNLSRSAELNPNNPDTLCELGRTYFEEKIIGMLCIITSWHLRSLRNTQGP
jgi:ppGpp synthetase/RelA/SpoT-type nucleotidyltranferase